MDKLISGAKKLGITLSNRQLEQFEVFYHALTDWNKRMNLTSVNVYEEVQITHFLDSLTVIPGLKKHLTGNALKIMDVGTGAGFPGIPLRIVLPDMLLSLLEATAKKGGFLRHITNKLGLDDVEIMSGLAENIAQDKKYRESFDIILSRALAPLAVLAELNLPLCRVDGCMIAQKKGDIRKEILAATNAIEILGGELGEIVEVQLNEFTDNRCLVIINKTRKTPEKYPRRPGIPAKRPLS